MQIEAIVRETELAIKLGLARPELARLRKEHLAQGEHWMYTSAPKTVVYVQAGVDRVAELLALKAEDAPVAEAPAPSGLNNWLPDEAVPKIKPNGLILARGRPAWWSPIEGVVRSSRFVNRKAVLINVSGRDVVCRVKDAGNYPVGMVIPVRPYENVYVAARHPRFPGKW